MADKKEGETLAESTDRRRLEKQAADLAAIKARETAVKAAIFRGEPEVDMGPFNLVQLGLSVALIDRDGHLWRADGQKLRLVKRSVT